MLKQRARAVSAGLRLADLVLLVAAFPAAYTVRDRFLITARGGLFAPASYLPYLAAVLLAFAAAAHFFELYAAYRRLGTAVEVLRILKALTLTALVVAAASFLWRGSDLSRLLFGLHFALAFAALTASRLVIRRLAHAARRRGRNTRAYAVVGSGERIAGVVEAIRAHREWGLVFVGHVLEEGAVAPPGERVLGRVRDFPAILEREVIDEVIFGVPRERLDEIEDALLACEEQGVSAKVVLNFFPRRIARIGVEELDGMPMLALSTAPDDAMRLAGKRAFDLLVASAALILASPLLLLAAVAIRIESPGPVLFRQRRVGLNGREFQLYKFRSMVDGADGRLDEVRHGNEMDGPAFKMAEDPRVTRVGRWLRRTSFDEVPQFWNVIRGEMSVVGPRPPVPEEVARYRRWQRRRLSVRPGITCEWQVAGRSDLDFDRWMELDLRYIDTWSLWGDVKIVLRTIPAVLLGRGAR
jgi:exopolysaccharide biosynthesis polyprenyl glycosylphosphotransferase